MPFHSDIQASWAPTTELCRTLAILSTRLTATQFTLLGLTGGEHVKLRWVSPAHLPYLAWHRDHFFQP